MAKAFYRYHHPPTPQRASRRFALPPHVITLVGGATCVALSWYVLVWRPLNRSITRHEARLNTVLSNLSTAALQATKLRRLSAHAQDAQRQLDLLLGQAGDLSLAFDTYLFEQATLAGLTLETYRCLTPAHQGQTEGRTRVECALSGNLFQILLFLKQLQTTSTGFAVKELQLTRQDTHQWRLQCTLLARKIRKQEPAAEENDHGDNAQDQ